MNKPIRALIVEDCELDAQLLLQELSHGGYEVTHARVETAEKMRAALQTGAWDVVLSDYNLPAFNAAAALEILRETALDVPFIIVSATGVDEEAAVAALKAGASDFLVKSRLARLIPALERELREARVRQEQAQAQALLEEQLRQAQKMDAIGQLAGGIAHDFNNLLTAILGYCELLTDQIGADKPISQDLQEIHAAATRAASLTKQLLAFSRKQVLTVTAVDLNQTVRTIETMLSRLIGEHITIRTLLAEDLHPVMADTTQVEQVLMNLALNARDAMPTGGTLTISTENVERPAPGGGRAASDQSVVEYVVLRVADSGVGMPPEVQSKIFEPFFTTKERGRGTGLGLAAVHGIVSQLGGFIEVDSRVGHGSTFLLYLPATRQEAKCPAERPREPSAPGSETILLVEDEPGVRAFVKIALERFGHRVIEADSGESALARAQNADQPIDLLLTDVVLPRMSGPELADRISSARPALRVLFMSGYAEQIATANAARAAQRQLIEKPFSAQTLLNRIRALMDAERVS